MTDTPPEAGRTGGGPVGRHRWRVAIITVLSEAVAVAEPPPDTLTCAGNGVPALGATFTVTVTGG